MQGLSPVGWENGEYARYAGEGSDASWLLECRVESWFMQNSQYKVLIG